MKFELMFVIVQSLIIIASMDFPSTWQASSHGNISDHFRIYVYSIVMLLLGFIKRIKIDYSNIDPLNINKLTWIFNVADITLQINVFYLLIRLVADIPLAHSTIIVMQ